MIRGKRCELGLGSPPAVTLAMARKVALEHHGTAMLGGDPLADKRAAKDVLSFAEAVDAYLEAKLSEFKNAKHRQQWRNTLVTYALPKLGRNALLGFCSSVVSDTVSNSLRVLKTYRQTSEVKVSYVDAAKTIIEEDGLAGLFGRGLKTRIMANGLQGVMFSVMWKYLDEQLNKKSKNDPAAQ